MFTGLTVAVGYTVIVNAKVVPVHPLAVGVTVMVAITGAVPELLAVKVGIIPVPLDDVPIDGVLFVHAKVVPATGPVKLIAETIAPLQTVALFTGSTVGVGFTVIVKANDVPVHPLAVGVTVMVAITGAVPVLRAVNVGIDPVPPAAKPMDVSLLVHVKVVPATGLLKVTATVAFPLQ